MGAFFVLMRLTYSNMWAKFQRNIQAVGTTDTNIKAEFDSQLGATYQLMLAKLKNFKTYQPYSFTTTAGTQYLPYPPGEVSIDGITITVGSINYPLRIYDSEMLWEQLNAISIQASALPQFYFPRRDDFGIWPIPQATYTGTMYYHYRDRNLSVADYSAGTIAVTNGAKTVTGTSTAFTSAMIGRWFTITDPTIGGQGYWYRIANVSGQTLTLFQNYTGTTATGVSLYNIGETPEIPEEGHMTLVDGITAGFYIDYRKDLQNGSLFMNKFYTGDPANASREEGDTKIAAGLIGLMNRYADRDDTRVIDRNLQLNPLQWKPWSTTLS